METWSTVTVIMQHKSVWKFFSDPDVQRHRFEDIFNVQKEWRIGTPNDNYGTSVVSVIDPIGNTIKDAVIGKWAEKNNLPVYFHTPALAEHIGYFSTLTDDVSNSDNNRMTEDFIGEEADLKSFIVDPIIYKINSVPLS